MVSVGVFAGGKFPTFLLALSRFQVRRKGSPSSEQELGKIAFDLLQSVVHGAVYLELQANGLGLRLTCLVLCVCVCGGGGMQVV